MSKVAKWAIKLNFCPWTTGDVKPSSACTSKTYSMLRNAYAVDAIDTLVKFNDTIQVYAKEHPVGSIEELRGIGIIKDALAGKLNRTGETLITGKMPSYEFHISDMISGIMDKYPVDANGNILIPINLETCGYMDNE